MNQFCPSLIYRAVLNSHLTVLQSLSFHFTTIGIYYFRPHCVLYCLNGSARLAVFTFTKYSYRFLTNGEKRSDRCTADLIRYQACKDNSLLLHDHASQCSDKKLVQNNFTFYNTNKHTSFTTHIRSVLHLR